MSGPGHDRPEPLLVAGLSGEEVARRRASGETNDVESVTSRSGRDIVHSNVFTRFNAIIATLVAVVLVFGHPIDAMFGVVMVANTTIGIAQEFRAKKTLDSLRSLIAPTVVVVRDGTEQRLPSKALVLGDRILLAAGDQVPVDGVVEDSRGLEIDESALTGEAEPVPKVAGDEVRSGSAVVAGSGTTTAVRVGREAWIHQLMTEAGEFALTRSELRVGVDRILWAVSWALPPLAALLFWGQLRGDATVAEGAVAATAGVVALVPQGLVLLVSAAMAVAVVRLARQNVVVQELYAVEGLARVDVICLDKTGTLTTGRTRVESIEALTGTTEELRTGLAALAGAEQPPTAAMQTIAAVLDDDPQWELARSIAFSSARKWSGATFVNGSTWMLGAPEILLARVDRTLRADVLRRVSLLTSEARRVLLVASSEQALGDGEGIPEDLVVRGLVALSEEVRPDAADTIEYFISQGVGVKVISGDNVETVSAIARQLSIPGAERAVDLRVVEEITADLAESNTIFGRVLPHQKRQLVEGLQQAGHIVAMTGDGVNDIPALKKADIGIAMDTATSATKAVAQLVLLNGRFDLLPGVVAEGRRVVANMERVSALFVSKTMYAAVFAIVLGISGVDFPFLPRHLTLTDSLTIGIPAFLLSFRFVSEPCRPGYLRRVVRFSVPAGLWASVLTLTIYWMARFGWDLPLDQSRSLATLTLGCAGLWILQWLVRPLDRLEGVLLGVLVASFVLVSIVPLSARFFALEFPDRSKTLSTLGVIVVVLAATQLLLVQRVRVDMGTDAVTAGSESQ